MIVINFVFGGWFYECTSVIIEIIYGMFISEQKKEIREI